jgi:hypothetical protein
MVIAIGLSWTEKYARLHSEPEPFSEPVGPAKLPPKGDRIEQLGSAQKAA